MKAKVNLRVEILDGEDAGYVLEETNRIVDLQDSQQGNPWNGLITPYRVTVEFVTPNLLRNRNAREIDDEAQT